MSKGNNSYSAAEIRARLSISTLVFQGYRPLCEAALEELAEHGICRIELLESPDQYDLGDKRCMRLVDQMCRNCGIEVVAYHAYKTSFEGVESEAQRQERGELCCRQLDTLLATLSSLIKVPEKPEHNGIQGIASDLWILDRLNRSFTF